MKPLNKRKGESAHLMVNLILFDVPVTIFLQVCNLLINMNYDRMRLYCVEKIMM